MSGENGENLVVTPDATKTYVKLTLNKGDPNSGSFNVSDQKDDVVVAKGEKLFEVTGEKDKDLHVVDVTPPIVEGGSSKRTRRYKKNVKKSKKRRSQRKKYW
jgi:hypothetical protein